MKLGLALGYWGAGPPPGTVEKVDAAEVTIGLAIIVVLFRNRASINVQDLDHLKG